MELFYVNALLYVLWAVWAYLHRRENSTFYLVAIGLYAIVACMGAYIFEVKIYQNDIPDHRSVEYLSYLPYLMMFIMTFAVITPIKNIRPFEIGWKDSYLNRVSNIFIVVQIVYIILFLHGFPFGSSTDLGDAYHMSTSGDLALRFRSDTEMVVYKIFRRLSICIGPIFFYLQFARIVKNKKSLISLIYIAVSFGINIIPAILTGSRGSMFFNLVAMLFIYTIFHSSIPVKVRKRIYGVAISFLGILAFYAIAISVARTKGDSDMAYERIFRYFGEPFVNLGLIYWDATDVHTYGLRFFPGAAKLVGLELPDAKYGIDAMREFWSKIYGVNMYYFKTLFGDLYLEFGVAGAFIVAGVLSGLAVLFKKVKNPLLYHFFFYNYVRGVILWGIFGFGVLQSFCIDFGYAIVFWIIFSKISNSSKTGKIVKETESDTVENKDDAEK